MAKVFTKPAPFIKETKGKFTVKKGEAISEDEESAGNETSDHLSMILGEVSIGQSIGCTIALPHYENVKVSVWMTRIVKDSPKIIEKNKQEISNFLINWLEEETKDLRP